MKMRPPAVPLITVDPYFSVWSASDKLNEKNTVHWTGRPNTLNGYVYVDGEAYSFMGENDAKRLEQTGFSYTSMTTSYEFQNRQIKLNALFFTPLIIDDLFLISRPVSYLRLSYSSIDGKEHDISFKITASEELCINKRGEEPVVCEKVETDKFVAMKMGSATQNILGRSGDDLRINWGYFYLCGDKDCTVAEDVIISGNSKKSEMTAVSISGKLHAGKIKDIVFAYDDIDSILYFGKPCKAYWKKDGMTITQAIADGLNETDALLARVNAFDKKLRDEAAAAGGEHYADLLELAYRQVIAAHKLALSPEGELLFVSKECFSNGCAVTVDVSYPSSPIFIKYNIELLKAMLTPIFSYARSEAWPYDFAPHDLGVYPFVNGQVYGMSQDKEKELNGQMPVEECGNMLIMTANVCLKENSGEFAKPYISILEKWCEYLLKYGEDPGNQLCTDDFAGHLAHNCNLSLKAIMGIAGLALIYDLLGDREKHDYYLSAAKTMANRWVERAGEYDGSFRLAFDKPNTFSMKYNMVWDKLWKTGLFAPCVYYSEFSSYKKHINPYGLPLDSRASYTKSDWLLWVALFAPTREEFEEFIEPLWRAYNVSPSRSPMTDWYDTNSSCRRDWFNGADLVGFTNRTVQGGLFIKLLQE